MMMMMMMMMVTVTKLLLRADLLAQWPFTEQAHTKHLKRKRREFTSLKFIAIP
jgi:hypothetical protein